MCSKYVAAAFTRASFEFLSCETCLERFDLVGTPNLWLLLVISVNVLCTLIFLSSGKRGPVGPQGPQGPPGPMGTPGEYWLMILFSSQNSHRKDQFEVLATILDISPWNSDICNHLFISHDALINSATLFENTLLHLIC